MGYIYMIKNKINGKIYIGQTIRSIKKRLGQHKIGQSKKCRAIYNAIKKYGWRNFEKDWYECPDEDLNFDEELLVREMKTLSPDGYNLREGGGSRGKMSEESKQRNRNAHIGKTHTKKTKQEMSKSRLGRVVSEETIHKLREANQGENNPMWGITGDKHSMSKRVYQYTRDGNFVRSFGSSGEAGRYLEKDGTQIRACARGAQGYKTAYNFKWSYEPHID
jgi:group I intron endonuclease